MIKTNNHERREYFRIDDEVYLEYDIISEDELNDAPQTLANLENSSFRLSADFATLNNNIHPLLNNIKQLHPDIGEYLEFLNQKIDSMNHLLLMTETSFDESKVFTANISASGICFPSKDEIAVSTPVKVELVLLPEKVGILLFGRVVTMKEHSKTHTRMVCIQFEHIRPEDRELMIKHNLNKQMADLREQKDNN